MDCPDCEGGYNRITVIKGGELKSVKEWCETCKGSGQVSYEGDRNGTEWES